jgi:hypothetical protein
MGLTDEERRRFDELADDLSREDPELSRALSGGPSWRRPRRRASLAAAIVLALASLPLDILGVSLAQPLLFAVGAIWLVAAVWIAVVISFRRFQRARLDHRG